MPKAVHWKAVLGILAYIKGTSDYGIVFQRGSLGSISLEVFVDANYAPKATDRWSVPGGAMMCCGACVVGFLGLRDV